MIKSKGQTRTGEAKEGRRQNKRRNKKVEEARENNKGIPVRPNEEMDESNAKSERYDLAR